MTNQTRILLGAVLFFSCHSMSTFSEEIIWMIGEEDGSNAEFAIAKEPNAYLKTFPNDVCYRVGSSSPDTGWSGMQPGPGDSWGGSRKNKFVIEFECDPEPEGVYLLQIRLVGYHPNQPQGMFVDINGARSPIGFPSGGHMNGYLDFALGKPFQIDMPLFAKDLRRGENSIAFESMSCWLLWDSIRLVHTAEAQPDALALQSVEFESLPLFVKTKGSLKQKARLSFVTTRLLKELKTRIHMNGETFTHPFKVTALGANKRDITIPEIQQEDHVKIEILHKKDVIFTGEFPVTPSRKWTISVVPQAHVDIGYTHLQDEAMEVHRKSNDMALEFIDKYPEFVWSIESTYVMEGWIKSRAPELIEYFFNKAREGKIEVEAIYSNLLTGLLSDEESFRSLYYSKQLSKEHDFIFGSATLTDAPSHIWSLPTVLRSSGVKYLSMGINTTRAPLLRGGLYKQSPTWWEGPDGSKILAYFHDHYAGAGAIGLTDAWSADGQKGSSLSTAEQRIPDLLRSYEREDYPYDAIHIHGAYGDNRSLTEQLPITVRAWNKKYEYPKIVFTTNTEWFSSFEEKYGENLKVARGDGGPYWEDGAGSTARETTINRQNQQNALLAEMLITGLHAKGIIQEDFRKLFADIWHNIMLYNEHTWGAHNSVSQPNLPEVLEQYRIKSEFALRAQQKIEPLLNIARQHIPIDERTKPEWSLQGERLVGARYDITFDLEQGGIKNIIDKETNQELIDSQSTYLLGQLIYARNEQPPYEFSVPKFEGIENSRNGVVLYWSHELFPEIKLTLNFDDARKAIAFKYDIQKKYTTEKEGVYIAFPLAGVNPQIDYAVANAVVRAGRDWLPGSCKDWFTLQNWLRVRNDGYDALFVTYDAPLINLQDINSNKWLEELPIRNGHVFAYPMNNYWFTNYRAGQAGKYTFRFALTSSQSISNSEALQFGRNWTNAERNAVDSMISVKPGSVVISGFKRAEYEDGYIVRLREMNGQTTEAVLHAPALATIHSSFLCNGVEDVLNELSVLDNAVQINLKPWEIATILVK